MTTINKCCKCILYLPGVQSTQLSYLADVDEERNSADERQWTSANEGSNQQNDSQEDTTRQLVAVCANCAHSSNNCVCADQERLV